jgi:hypothetical protein
MIAGHAMLLALVAGAFLHAPAWAQREVGMNLEAAGFVMREANTPQKMEQLRTLPAHKFVARTKSGTRYYIFADPQYCRCAFVGSQAAYDRYRSMTARFTPPPGYTGPADISSSSGVNPMHEVIDDMNQDMETQLEREGDMFHPGF